MMEHNIIDDGALDAVNGGTEGGAYRATENEKKKARLAQIEEELKKPGLTFNERGKLMAEMMMIRDWLKKHGDL